MSLARLCCLTIAVFVTMGCGRSKPTAPTVRVTTPEDGGAAGNGFDSHWTDAYATDPRMRTNGNRPQPGMSAADTRGMPTRPSGSRPVITLPPAVNTPTVTTPNPPASPTRTVANPIDVPQLSLTLEPIVVKLTMTKQDGRVVQGGGVVVGKDGLVVTAAALIKDAVAGEAEFCNQQKTQVLGYFPSNNDPEDPLAAVIVDTHGYELEAARVDRFLGAKDMTVKIGDPLLYFKTDAFPFPRDQIVADGLLQPRRLGFGNSEPKKYRTIYTTARDEDSPQGNPMFDRAGALTAITIANKINAQVIAVSIHEIAEQLPSMSLSSSIRYTGKPAPAGR